MPRAKKVVMSVEPPPSEPSEPIVEPAAPTTSGAAFRRSRVLPVAIITLFAAAAYSLAAPTTPKTPVRKPAAVCVKEGATVSGASGCCGGLYKNSLNVCVKKQNGCGLIGAKAIAFKNGCCSQYVEVGTVGVCKMAGCASEGGAYNDYALGCCSGLFPSDGATCQKALSGCLPPIVNLAVDSPGGPTPVSPETLVAKYTILNPIGNATSTACSALKPKSFTMELQGNLLLGAGITKMSLYDTVVASSTAALIGTKDIFTLGPKIVESGTSTFQAGVPRTVLVTLNTSKAWPGATSTVRMHNSVFTDALSQPIQSSYNPAQTTSKLIISY